MGSCSSLALISSVTGGSSEASAARLREVVDELVDQLPLRFRGQRGLDDLRRRLDRQVGHLAAQLLDGQLLLALDLLLGLAAPCCSASARAWADEVGLQLLRVRERALDDLLALAARLAQQLLVLGEQAPAPRSFAFCAPSTASRMPFSRSSIMASSGFQPSFASTKAKSSEEDTVQT